MAGLASTLEKLVQTPGFKPTLRSDLEYREETDLDLVEVRDPRDGHRLQLKAIECLIAREMDGTRNLDEVVAAAKPHAPWITREHVERLVVQVAQLGLLENMPRPSNARPMPPRPPPKPSLATGSTKTPSKPSQDAEFAEFILLEDAEADDTVVDVSGAIADAIAMLDRNAGWVEAPESPPEPPPPPGGSTVRSSTDGAEFSGITGSRPRAPSPSEAQRRQPTPPPVVVAPEAQPTVIEPHTAPPATRASTTPGPGPGPSPAPSSVSGEVAVAPMRRSSQQEASAPMRRSSQQEASAPMRRSSQQEASAPDYALFEPGAEDMFDDVMTVADPHLSMRPLSQPLPVQAAPIFLPPDAMLGAPVLGQATAAGPRRWYSRRWVQALIALGVLGIALGVLAAIPYEIRVVEECVVDIKQKVAVRTPIDGIIGEVLAKDAAVIDKGTPLLRLADRQGDFELKQLKEERDGLQTKLAELEKGTTPPAPSGIGRARRLVRAAQDDVRRAQRALKQASGDEKAKARKTLTIKQAALAEMQAQLRSQQAAVKTVYDTEAIEATKAAIKKLDDKIGYLEKQQELLLVKSPVNGQILTADFSQKLNQRVQAGDVVAEIGDDSVLKVKIELSGDQAELIELGQPLSIKLHNLPDKLFSATINNVAPAESGKIRVEAEIDNADHALEPPLSGIAEIDAGERSLLGELWQRIF